MAALPRSGYGRSRADCVSDPTRRRLVKRTGPKRLACQALVIVVALAQPPVGLARAQGISAGGATTRTVQATRITKPPVIDGSDDDEAWRSIPPTRGFRTYYPQEDGVPTFDTEFRVAYDDRNLYVVVRAFDPHPDSIVRLLSRRDVKTNSDQLGLFIDAFHDRRNALEFLVNPAGVKRDGAFYNDNTEDMSWDGVWDVGVGVDDRGWVAEFRIPFSQLRFANASTHTFGFSVGREVARLNEKSAWPLFRQSVNGVASQLGTLDGIADVPATRRLEILPYTVAKSMPDLTAPGRANRTEMAAGLDAKAGLGPNLTLDATINPDFGQVEADPAILNLTAFETRFDERRLFFQEGLGLFRCGAPCDGPFYTRRIGRAPQLRTSAADPAFTSILGAGKLTGRFANGFTVALLDAVTAEERGASGAVVEPGTNYLVMRTAREARDGSRQIGFLLTDVHRQLDVHTDSLLRRSGTMMELQGSARFAHDVFEVMAYSGQAYVTGSASAIALTQRSSVHYFQRPDADVRYDSTRTSLFGGATGLSLRRIRGAIRFETFVRHSTPEQEMNDLGLVPLVGENSIRQTIDFQPTSPGRWFRSSFSEIRAESHWTTGGLGTGQFLFVHTSGTLYSNWGGAITYNGDDFGGGVCVSCARGGPSVRKSPRHTLRFDVSGDGRRAFVPQFTWIVMRGDEGRSSSREMDAGFSVRVASQFSASLNAAYNRGTNDQQWVSNYGALLSDTTHYTFARLDQTTLAFTARANWTATRDISLQLYAQPFVTAGAYSAWRELGVPRATSYDQRFRPYGAGATPAGFNVKQFNANAVLRWEYRPSSTLFLVWQQGRFQDALNQGSFSGPRDVRDLFAVPSQNTILLKASYWINP